MKTKNFTILVITFCFALGAFNGYSQKKKSSGDNSQALVNESNTSEESESSSATKPAENMSTLQKHSKEIQTIIKNENGVVRGLDFGVPLDKIKSTETAEVASEGKDYIIYKVKLNEKESVEVVYYLDETMKLKGFGIAFMVDAALVANNVEATLIDDFQNYFNERYGKLTTNEKNDDVWTSKDGSYTVEMGDSSDGLELTEIEIEIFKKK